MRRFPHGCSRHRRQYVARSLSPHRLLFLLLPTACGCALLHRRLPGLCCRPRAKRSPLLSLALSAPRLLPHPPAGLYAWGSKNHVGLGLDDHRRAALNWNYKPLCVVRTSINVDRKEHRGGVRDRVLSVACGSDFTAAVTHDGDLLAWGGNAYGQLGCGDRTPCYAPQRVPIQTRSGSNARIRSVACGARHAAAIVATGRMFLWGAGANGEQGLGEELSDQLSPKLCAQPGLRHAIQVACGWRSTVVLTEEHRLFAWGIVGCVPADAVDDAASSAEVRSSGEESDATLRRTLVPTLVPYSSVPGRALALSSSCSQRYAVTSVHYRSETVETALRRQKRAEKRMYRSPEKSPPRGVAQLGGCSAGSPAASVAGSVGGSPGAPRELASDAADAIRALHNREDLLLEEEIAGAARLASGRGGDGGGGGAEGRGAPQGDASGGDDLDVLSVSELRELVLAMQAEDAGEGGTAPARDALNRERERAWKAEHHGRLHHHLQPASRVPRGDDAGGGGGGGATKYHSRFRDAYGRAYSMDARTRTDLRGFVETQRERDEGEGEGGGAPSGSSAARAASIALPQSYAAHGTVTPLSLAAEEDDLLAHFAPALLVNAANPDFAVRRRAADDGATTRLSTDAVLSLMESEASEAKVAGGAASVEAHDSLALFRKAHPDVNRSTGGFAPAVEEPSEESEEVPSEPAMPRWTGRRDSEIGRRRITIKEQVWRDAPSASRWDYDDGAEEEEEEEEEATAATQGQQRRAVPPPPPPAPPLTTTQAAALFADRDSRAALARERRYNAVDAQRERDAAFEAAEAALMVDGESVLDRLRHEGSLDAVRMGRRV